MKKSNLPTKALRRNSVLRCNVACLLVCILAFALNARGQDDDDELTLSPEDGSVYLMGDESVSLSASPASDDADPGEEPNDLGCDCINGHPSSPVPDIEEEWSGDIVDDGSGEEDSWRLDTSTEGDKTVTVNYYATWDCEEITNGPGIGDNAKKGSKPRRKRKLVPTANDTGDDGDRTLVATATAHYTVVRPTVSSVAFDESYPLHKWADHSTISNPVWQQSGGSVTKNEAAAYQMGDTAQAELNISADEALENTTHVQVRGQPAGEGDLTFSQQDAWFGDWTWEPQELVLPSDTLQNSVGKYELGVNWQYRVSKPGGGWTDWFDMNTSNHILYTLYSDPAVTPTFDKALEKACYYANNQEDQDSIGTCLSYGLGNDGELTYDPGDTTDYDDDYTLSFYDHKTLVCYSYAKLMRYLADSIGADASFVAIWGGSDQSHACFYASLGGGPTASHYTYTLQVTAPAKGGAYENPEFAYHAETMIGSQYYNPAYGTVGLITFIKQAMGGVTYYVDSPLGGGYLTTVESPRASPPVSRQIAPFDTYSSATKYYYDHAGVAP